MTERDIVLIDMDCFYVQVEQRLNPSLKGKPCAVVQYKTWKGGGIIAVGYEARAMGVTRQMRGDDAKEKCPEIHLARVPEIRGKADLTRYREAGAEVISVFSKFCSCVERASVDEAFLDITAEVSQRLKALGESSTVAEQIPNTFVEGYAGAEGRSEWLEHVRSPAGPDCERRLAVAAAMVEEMRAAVMTETGFTCSAGIAHNKMLAKLACGRNKPNKQTIFPLSSVPSVFSTLPIPKIRHLGGKLGAFLTDDLHLQHMGDLVKFTEQELQAHCGHKTGSWLYHACRGVESESVSTRELPKSIGCSKNFRGKEILDTKEKVKFWLSELSKEVSERLDKDKLQNKRQAKSLTVCLRAKQESGSTSSSRACLLARYDPEKICSDAYTMIKQFNMSSSNSPHWTPPLTNLGLSASKFTEQGDNQKISTMFMTAAASATTQQSQYQPLTHGLTQSGASTHQEDETYEEMMDVVNPTQLPKAKALPSSKSKSPGSISVSGTKAAKSKQPDKENFVSIKSFFSQKMAACAGKCGDDEQEESTSVESKSLDPENGEAGEGACLQPGRSSTGFFASKMRSLGSSLVKPAVENTAENVMTNQVIISPKTATKTTDSQFTERDDFSHEEKQPCSVEVSRSSDAHEKDISNSNTSSSAPIEGTGICNTSSTTSIIQTTTVSEPRKFNNDETTTNKAIPPPPSISTDNLASSEDFMECDTCGEFVSVWEMPEHSDFHFAQALQKEVNKTQSVPSNSSTFTLGSLASGSNQQMKRRKVMPGVVTKGGRGGKQSKATDRDKSIQPLTMFFSKS